MRGEERRMGLGAVAGFANVLILGGATHREERGSAGGRPLAGVDLGEPAPTGNTSPDLEVRAWIEVRVPWVPWLQSTQRRVCDEKEAAGVVYRGAASTMDCEATSAVDRSGHG